MSDERFDGFGQSLPPPPDEQPMISGTAALKDRVDALARLAADQQQVNRRMLRIRTSTATIAVTGWIMALLALLLR